MKVDIANSVALLTYGLCSLVKRLHRTNFHSSRKEMDKIHVQELFYGEYIFCIRCFKTGLILKICLPLGMFNNKNQNFVSTENFPLHNL